MSLDAAVILFESVWLAHGLPPADLTQRIVYGALCESPRMTALEIAEAIYENQKRSREIQEILLQLDRLGLAEIRLRDASWSAVVPKRGEK